jgi:hypothetical protein
MFISDLWTNSMVFCSVRAMPARIAPRAMSTLMVHLYSHLKQSFCFHHLCVGFASNLKHSIYSCFAILFQTRKRPHLASAHSSRPQVRHLNIHEYQSMALMRKFNINVPKCEVATTPEEAKAAAEKLASQGVHDFVVKAQVLAGGRGKGTFSTGYKGGVHTATSPEAASQIASKMLGARLITKQTGADGRPCNAVLITERQYLRRETYFSLMLERTTQGPVMVVRYSRSAVHHSTFFFFFFFFFFFLLWLG